MLDKWGRSTESYPRVREYFDKKTIFITGASGFIGRVLIEKLLRSCPGIRRMYILLRPKKGLSTKERVDKLFSVELFEKLDKLTNGTWKNKIHVIEGDIMELNLGISEKDEKILINEVNVFYHNAASIRFDDSLRNAVRMNTRGTREACKLALKMKHFEMFFHVSTTYCNIHMGAVREEIHPPVADWQQMIYLAENMDEYSLQQVAFKMMEQFPNTYTFSKNLAEHVVNDLCDGKIPAVILRPSIVVSSFGDPIAGWIDNYNGPAGVLAACAKGIMRVNLMNLDVRMDYVPVDYLVKAMIGLVAYRQTREDKNSVKKLQVYNSSADLKYSVSGWRSLEIAEQMIDEMPYANPLWYPGGAATSSKTSYYIQFLILQLLPAVFVDFVLKLTGNKPILFEIQKKIYVANSVLHYFFNTEWKFINDKLLAMKLEIKKDDLEEFHVDIDIDHYEFFKNAAIGGKVYLLHEDLKDLDKQKKRLYKMKILHYVCKTLFWILVLYFVYSYSHLFNVKSYFVNYLHYLDKKMEGVSLNEMFGLIRK